MISNHNEFLVIIRMSKDNVVYLYFLRLLENTLRFTMRINVAELINNCVFRKNGLARITAIIINIKPPILFMNHLHKI